MQKRYYIAYGSNLNIRQMRMRCPHARVVGTAVIKDYELLFQGKPYGSLSYHRTEEGRSGSRCSMGKLRNRMRRHLTATKDSQYFITRRKWNWTSREYGRGRYGEGSAFVYIMHEERKIGVPSLSYVSTCLQGYISFGFDEHYLSEAQIKAVEVVGHEE